MEEIGSLLDRDEYKRWLEQAEHTLASALTTPLRR
jgi:hypothetical protein